METMELKEHQPITCNPTYTASMPHVPHLSILQNFLLHSKKEIVNIWVEKDSTTTLLQKLEIEPEFFKTTYGIPVVNYFIGVIAGENELGNCPVMQKFIAFLTEKNITAQDIFILCMALRRSLIKHVFDKNSIKIDDTVAILEEISTIFDANLSGVLQTFSDLTRQKDKKLQEQLIINKQQKQLQMILNFQNNIVCVVKNKKIVIANRKFFDTLGIKNLKEFHKLYPKEWGFIKSVNYKKELFSTKAYDSWFESIIDAPDKMIKISLINHETHKTGVFILKASLLPEGANNFILSITDVSSYEKQVEALKAHAYTHPVTKIYNRLKFDLILKERLQKTDVISEPLSIITIELGRFAYLQKTYDPLVIDAVLLQISEYIKLGLHEQQVTFAQIEAFRFALFAKQDYFDDLHAYAQTLQERLLEIDTDLQDDVSFNIGIFNIYHDDDHDSIMKRINNLNMTLQFDDKCNIKDDKHIYDKQIELEKESREISSRIQNMPSDIKATVSYKEINIHWDLHYKRFLEDSLLFTISKEVSILFNANKIYFALSADTQNIMADIKKLDLSTRELELANFQYTENSILDRKSLHVQPQKGITLMVHDAQISFQGTIQNLEQESLQFLTDDLHSIAIGEQVMLDFVLEHEEKTKISTEGYIKNIQQAAQGYSVSVILILDHSAENKLKAYIAHRQLEIIKELNNLINNIN